MTLPPLLHRSTTTFIRLTLKFGIDSVLLLSITSTVPLDADSSSPALIPQILSTLEHQGKQPELTFLTHRLTHPFGHRNRDGAPSNPTPQDQKPKLLHTFPAVLERDPRLEDVRECEEKFGVSCEKELTTEEVVKRHQIYGLNELEKPEGTSIFKLILEQFNGTLVRILLAAVVISFALAFVDDKEGGEMGITAFVEPHVVFLILIVNAIVGIWQETNAEKALEALKEIQSQQATVMRDGNKVSNLPAKELVVGDIVELRVGDKVPSDMCMVALISSTLRVEQGSLTGESEAVRTTFVNGNGICLVTDTGMSTEIGRVHSQIQEAA
ncbi:hypothetical protein Bca4012_038326 [Brassica carinata]